MGHSERKGHAGPPSGTWPRHPLCRSWSGLWVVTVPHPHDHLLGNCRTPHHRGREMSTSAGSQCLLSPCPCPPLPDQQDCPPWFPGPTSTGAAGPWILQTQLPWASAPGAEPSGWVFTARLSQPGQRHLLSSRPLQSTPGTPTRGWAQAR